MTSTNVRPVQEAASAFKSLIIDDQLAVLASFYKQIADSIPADAANALPTQDANSLISRIQQLSLENQLSALREFLSPERNDKDASVLDPHPSKALAELVTGNDTKIPAHAYDSLGAEGKIAFWYLLAGKLGSGFVGIPNGTQLTQDATEVLTTLQSFNTDELVSFLKLVV
ncbi:Orange carotenoid-binding protein [Scytonema sp. UIC 10036]|uniref:orange carotenoid protein N-terminal domain-containing protein n=1 Tax=Scytonema sp. UIC 10036 TaxID=2304196 RepID=UPI0012DA3F60|nr:orange carotenoid protein N-terminal domain-containing protein [Scytonema sp. UIC 10036]MUG93115.1 Orange carotenoid-binding protein [Scytonema sp. UIC 10036]